MKFSMARELEGQATTPEMQTRSALLAKLLSRNGMPLRDDSQLAYKYIVHDGDVQLVAHEILCTNFLFQHTDYAKNCEQAMRQLARIAHEHYGLPWKVAYAHAREYGVPATKYNSLAQAGYSMPDFDVRLEEAVQ
tara:strand:- start:864 stop:1268 length:405 start_codon:yes stop_codon:yes gene_type:complete